VKNSTGGDYIREVCYLKLCFVEQLQPCLFENAESILDNSATPLELSIVQGLNNSGIAVGTMWSHKPQQKGIPTIP
jgi:hypothetical protein